MNLVPRLLTKKHSEPVPARPQAPPTAEDWEDLAHWLEESGRRKAVADWVERERHGHEPRDPPRRSSESKPHMLLLLALAAASFLLYYYMDVELQIALLPYVIVFI